MDDQAPLGPQEYLCPICGERVVLGSHFCGARAEQSARPRPNESSFTKKRSFNVDFRLPGKPALNVSIAVALMAALLLGLIGAAAILLAPLILALVLLLFVVPDIRASRLSRSYRELLGMVGGDRETAERLVELEGQGVPDKTRRQRIELALYRLKRDHT